ncbi:MAG: extracellular solute-binding protein, partial [Clostridia bacterium]|nr:extracellular solute-binding protein [Clostridia bacterium]
MMHKKRLSCLLAMLMVSSAFSGCTETSEKTETAETAPVQEEIQTETISFEDMSFVERMQYTRADIHDGLPEKDYNGYTFRIQEGTYNERYFILKTIDDTGEAVDASMYNRQLAIEERFNIVFKDSGIAAGVSTFDVFQSSVDSVLMTGEDAIDLMKIWNTMAAKWVAMGHFLDLSEIDVLDFGKPWFYQDAIKALSYKNHVYLSIDMAVPFFDDLNAVFYNKELAADHGIENLYDMVRNDEWTMDTFTALAKDLWVDTNGDGIVQSDADTFGAEFATAEFGYMGAPTFGITLIGKDENDVPVLNTEINAERFDTVYSALRDLLKCDGVVFADWGSPNFIAGRTVFAVRALNLLTSLRDVDFDFGVLPLFKWDEHQENYGSAYLPYPNAIPGTVTDPERSAIILSALAASGYKEVLPV